MRDGVRAVIEACILLAEGGRLFVDQEQNDEFRRALVDWKVLPRRSSRAARQLVTRPSDRATHICSGLRREALGRCRFGVEPTKGWRKMPSALSWRKRAICRSLGTGCFLVAALERFSEILLPRHPDSPNVTDANVIAIARRGQGIERGEAGFHWISEAALDVEILAERLAPESKQRLHLFAATKSEGWCCIVGEANWSDDDV